MLLKHAQIVFPLWPTPQCLPISLRVKAKVPTRPTGFHDLASCFLPTLAFYTRLRSLCSAQSHLWAFAPPIPPASSTLCLDTSWLIPLLWSPSFPLIPLSCSIFIHRSYHHLPYLRRLFAYCLSLPLECKLCLICSRLYSHCLG